MHHVSMNPNSTSWEEMMDDVDWQSVVELASDKIVDVRIGVARLVGVICGMFLFFFCFSLLC